TFLERKPANSCKISKCRWGNDNENHKSPNPAGNGFLPGQPKFATSWTALNARPTENHCSARKRRYPPTQCSCLKYRKQMMKLIHFLSRYDYVYQTVSAISTTCFNLFYWSSSVTLLPSSVLANPH